MNRPETKLPQAERDSPERSLNVHAPEATVIGQPAKSVICTDGEKEGYHRHAYGQGGRHHAGWRVSLSTLPVGRIDDIDSRCRSTLISLFCILPIPAPGGHSRISLRSCGNVFNMGRKLRPPPQGPKTVSKTYWNSAELNSILLSCLSVSLVTI